MKFSALTIFLILLIVLVVITLICKCLESYEEGMIAYQHNVGTNSVINVPMYSESTNKLHKIHDSVYFDNKNGNLIEIDG